MAEVLCGGFTFLPPDQKVGLPETSRKLRAQLGRPRGCGTVRFQ